MRSPFEALFISDDDGWQDVEGSFECDTCFTIVHAARYHEQNETLLWVCENQHENRLEGFTL